MTPKNRLTLQSIHTGSLIKRILLGAGIALALITFFLLKAGEPNPIWPKLWWIKPIVIVPLAGATGGAFYYFMVHHLFQSGWKKALASVLSLIVYIIGLWLGTVLGLDGTYWN